MTAKRFEFREINEPPILPKCYDTEKQEYANLFECVGWLNELYGENQNLREILKFLPNDNSEDILNVLNTQQNEIVRLIEENEQLKQLVNIADDLIDKLGSETMQNEWIKNF